jgi:hypothetical protein
VKLFIFVFYYDAISVLTGQVVLKLIMIAIYLVLGLLYNNCKQVGVGVEGEKLKFTDPVVCSFNVLYFLIGFLVFAFVLSMISFQLCFLSLLVLILSSV